MITIFLAETTREKKLILTDGELRQKYMLPQNVFKSSSVTRLIVEMPKQYPSADVQ